DLNLPPMKKSHRVLDLSFRLRSVRTAKAGYKSVMCEEVFELRIPVRIRGFESSFQDDLLHVVVEDFLGITSEILERIEMAPDKGVNVDLEGELGISHAGIAEDHGETV